MNMKRDAPRVCANCKWAELVKNECQGIEFGVKCHRYPNYLPHEEHGWCGEFAIAKREMRYDLPYPCYQEVDRA